MPIKQLTENTVSVVRMNVPGGNNDAVNNTFRLSKVKKKSVPKQKLTDIRKDHNLQGGVVRHNQFHAVRGHESTPNEVTVLLRVLRNLLPLRVFHSKSASKRAHTVIVVPGGSANGVDETIWSNKSRELFEIFSGIANSP